MLLHGGAGSWMHWIRNLDELARDHTVWAPDLPGFGDSDSPNPELDADSLVPYVLTGLKRVLGSARFDLVGFSFGGLVAGLIAARRPAGLGRLVLVSVAALGLVSTPPPLKSMRGVQDPAERADIVRWNLEQMMLFDAASVDALALAVQQRSAPRDRLKNRKLALGDSILRLAPHWRCAAYGIWGRQDALYRDQIPALKAAIETLALREATIIENAGHWLQFECSDEFNRHLGGVLAHARFTGHDGGSNGVE